MRTEEGHTKTARFPYVAPIFNSLAFNATRDDSIDKIEN